jgi:hypothetical protein
MKNWLAFSLYTLTALWILMAGLRAGLRPRPRRRNDRPEVPAGQGLRSLTRLLTATGSSTYARDRIQERLHILAEDLSALEGNTEVRRSPRGWLQPTGGMLADYFAEDHVGLKGSTHGKHTLDPHFLQRTEDVMRYLEQDLQGDPHEP